MSDENLLIEILGVFEHSVITFGRHMKIYLSIKSCVWYNVSKLFKTMMKRIAAELIFCFETAAQTLTEFV